MMTVLRPSLLSGAILGWGDQKMAEGWPVSLYTRARTGADWRIWRNKLFTSYKAKNTTVALNISGPLDLGGQIQRLWLDCNIASAMEQRVKIYGKCDGATSDSDIEGRFWWVISKSHQELSLGEERQRALNNSKKRFAIWTSDMEWCNKIWSVGWAGWSDGSCVIAISHRRGIRGHEQLYTRDCDIAKMRYMR